MPPPIVSRGEFAELWKAKKGDVVAVASTLNTDTRSVLRRRRRIELETGIRLPALGKSDHGVAMAARYEALSPREHKAWQRISVDTGTVVVFSDAHFWPGVRTAAFRGMLHLIRELQPVSVICNGDAFDGASISRFPRIGWSSTPSVKDEIKACESRLLEIEDAAGKAKLVWPLGNHDMRFETRLAAVAPEFQGMNAFSLRDHFPAWAPCWAAAINEDVVVKHRYKGGIHATRNNTLSGGKTIVTGHLHSLKVAPLSDYNGTRWGVDTGTLAEPMGDQFIDYTEAGPLDWRSGFAVLTFHKGRLLWPELAHATGDTLDFRGQLMEV